MRNLQNVSALKRIPINIESTHHIPETNTILCQLHYNYKKEQVSPNQRVSFLNGL